MDRLTYREEDGRVRLTKYGMQMYCSTQATADCFAKLEERLAAYEDTWKEPEECKTLYNIISKLSGELTKYKEAEKEGRLIVLPCKVGDTVYKPFLRPLSVVPMIVRRIVLDGIDNQIIIGGGRAVCFSDIGKTIFLTREEAEAALERSKPHGD